MDFPFPKFSKLHLSVQTKSIRLSSVDFNVCIGIIWDNYIVNYGNGRDGTEHKGT